MKMTIDEAIKHAEEVGNGCNECAAEHRQLAKWLRKYQKIEEIMKSKKMDALNIGLLIPKDMACVLHEIKEVVEDGNDD